MAGRMALWRKVAAETFARWDAHNAWTHSAALAFYTLFSLAPVLIVVVSLSGAVFGQELVRGRVVREFQQLMGHETGQAVQGILEAAAKTVTGGIAGTIGLLTLLFGATAVFIELQVALNVIWEVAPKPGHLLRRLLIKRLLSFALVIAIGFLLLVSLTLSAALSALHDYMRTRMGTPVLLDAVNAFFTFAVLSLLFALIYHGLHGSRPRHDRHVPGGSGRRARRRRSGLGLDLERVGHVDDPLDRPDRLFDLLFFLFAVDRPRERHDTVRHVHGHSRQRREPH